MIYFYENLIVFYFTTDYGTYGSNLTFSGISKEMILVQFIGG